MTDRSVSPSPLPPSFVADLDRAAQSAFEQAAGTPGAVVGVQTAGGSWIGTYGVADPASGTPITRATRLRIGSVTKTFTATVLLQLIEAGDLALDARVGDFVSGIPGGDHITLELLATMRSGLANYTADPAFVGQVVADPMAPRTPDEMIAAGVAQSPSFAPDARFEYSNTNYILLGQILEQVTQRTLGALFDRRIIEPLGLSATWWPGDSTELPVPHAQGFTLSFPGATPDQPVNATHFNPAWAGAAGALVSTVENLLVYSRALVTGQGLLGADTQQVRLGSLRPAPAMGDSVTYGIGLMGIDGWLGHSGDIPGYRASVYHHPEIDTSMVVLTSSDIVAGRCGGAAAAVAIATEAPCSSPTARIFDAVSAVLGRPTATPTGPAAGS